MVTKKNSKNAPWNKSNPTSKTTKTKLTPEQIEEAKERAFKAGRPYPNLIDNMAIARASKNKTD